MSTSVCGSADTDKEKPAAPPTVAEVMKKLADPFPPAAVKMRSDGKPGQDGKARCVAYIDARTVATRLNNVLGGDGWKTRMTVLPSGAVLCRLAVRFPGKPEWIGREDVGSESAQKDQGDRTKAAVSDALKRAAVQFGVGAYLYKLPKYRLKVDGFGNVDELWTLPLWAIPDDFKPVGANHAVTLLKLLVTYTNAAGKNDKEYLAQLLREHGYGPETTLSQVERRHARAMMQAINDGIAEQAKKPAADLPQSGPELLKWITDKEAKWVESGLCAEREAVTAVISAGATAGFSTSIDEWSSPQQIKYAVEVARNFHKRKSAELEKKKSLPQTAGNTAIV